MTEDEKILLLELILKDVRGNWGWENSPRIPMARTLATELGFNMHVELINEYDFQDGRHFRTHCRNGGYEGMNEAHGLTYTIMNKSEEFQNEAVAYLTYPDTVFDDWKEFRE